MFLSLLPLFLSVIWSSSVILGMASSTFFVSWVFLEVNLLSFIAMLCMSLKLEAWTGFKYFIVQSLGSVLFLLALMIGSGVSVVAGLMTLSIFLKLGGAPFHGWVLSMSSELSWDVFFVLMTIQKVLPLYIIMSMGSSVIFWLIMVGGAISLLGGLCRVGLKELVIYSSVLSVSWMVASGSLFMVFLFLLSYSASLFFISNYLSRLYPLSLESDWHGLSGGMTAMMLFLFLVNLAGVPPLVGFYAKVAMLSEIQNNYGQLSLSWLIFASGVYVFIYLRICLFKLSLASGGHVFSASTKGKMEGGAVFFILSAVAMFLLYVCKGSIWNYEG